MRLRCRFLIFLSTCVTLFFKICPCLISDHPNQFPWSILWNDPARPFGGQDGPCCPSKRRKHNSVNLIGWSNPPFCSPIVMLTVPHLSCLSTATPEAQWIPPSALWGHSVHQNTRAELEPESWELLIKNQGALSFSPLHPLYLDSVHCVCVDLQY